MTITDFIPQRPPVVMIDRLLETTDNSATSSFLITHENIFVEEGRFTEPGLIENIAQTAAAMVGHQCAMKSVEVPLGYIAAVKSLRIELLPSVGTTIQTQITVTNHVMNVTIIRGSVEQSGKILCTCEMKIMIRNQT
jgi:3-hydroxyacyl-[acyl-carrier-protein] dehydratase